MGRKAKRKTENKLKRHEIEFGGKTINMIRFAYDVFRYIALKFGVLKTSIAQIHGPANDYIHPGYISVVSRAVMVDQIQLREPCNQHFIYLLPSYRNLSNEVICSILQEVIKGATSSNKLLDVYIRVGISLCVACELILFLYSRDSSLYLRVLPKCWFDCYFYNEKEEFGARGLAELYYGGIFQKSMLPDQEFDEFISLRCRDYKESTEDVDIKRKYEEYFEVYHKNHPEVIPKLLKGARRIVILSQPLTSQQDEASGFDFPPNPDLPDDEIPEWSYDERPSHSTGLSDEERGMDRNYSSRPSFEQDTGQLSLDFSEMRLSSERNASVSGAEAATPNYSLLGAKPKEPRKDDTEASGTQTSEPSLDSSRQEKAKSKSKKSKKKKSKVSVAEDAATSHNLPGTRLQIPVEYAQGPTGVQTSTSGLRPVEEQRLGQSGLDSPAKKPSKKKKPKGSTAKDATPSYEFPRVRPKIAAEHSQGSSGLPTSESSLHSSLEQGLEHLSLDSSGTEKSRKKRTNKSENDPAPSYSFPPVSQDPAKELGGSSSEEEKQEKDIHEEK